jgi:plasmid stabilization system protein ParE
MGALQVGFSRRAQRDLVSIVKHVAKDDPSAAESLGLKLTGRALSLTDVPIAAAGSILRNSGGARKLIEGAYLIVYDVDLQAGKVRVLRFWHTAQLPERFRLAR